MSNDLQNLNNIYLDLAKGAYPDKSNSLRLPMERLTPEQQKSLLSGKAVIRDFSKDVGNIPGGQAPEVNYKLYLQ